MDTAYLWTSELSWPTMIPSDIKDKNIASKTLSTGQCRLTTPDANTNYL